MEAREPVRVRIQPVAVIEVQDRPVAVQYGIWIGKVVDVQPFPRARNPSYKVGVDVGADRIMWSSAQITNYEPAALLGSLVVCVCNLGAKNIAGFTSELLILGAKDANGNVIVLGPRSKVAIGEAIF